MYVGAFIPSCSNGAGMLTEGSLGAVQAGQVVGLGAALFVTQHQLATIATAETLVLRLLLPLGTRPALLHSFLGLLSLDLSGQTIGIL